MKLMRMRVLERKREYCGGRARDQVLEESLVDLIMVCGVCMYVHNNNYENEKQRKKYIENLLPA